MNKTALKTVSLAICLMIAAGIGLDARADEIQDFSGRDLEKYLRQTDQELKTMKALEKKLVSAARQSSNTARKSAVNDLQDHMAKCILRREDDLGREHTIRMHGEHVAAGTTGAAEVGAPVGASNSNSTLNNMEGLDGMRLRQLSRLQAIYVAAKHNMLPAMEKQGEALDRYTEQVARFRKELENSRNFLENELQKRARDQEKEKEQEKKQEKGR